MRHVELEIEYNSKDITKDLTPYIKTISYTDNAVREVDSISLTVENTKELWQKGWLPTKGDSIGKFNIKAKDWLLKGDSHTLECGKFEVDEMVGQDYPSEVTIRAISIPINSRLREEGKTRGWENTRLSVIANDIASNANMQLFYDADYDQILKRIDQTEESDLEFLLKACKEAGLALKVSDGKIIIFDFYKYEQAAPILTIEKGISLIKSASYKTKTRDVYMGVRIGYQMGKKKGKFDYIYDLPGKTTGKMLKINHRVESIADAEHLAKKSLREKNKDEWTMSLTTLGDVRLVAGVTVIIKGWGAWDGKYFVDRATHSPIGGYTTKIDIHRCLEGY